MADIARKKLLKRLSMRDNLRRKKTRLNTHRTVSSHTCLRHWLARTITSSRPLDSVTPRNTLDTYSKKCKEWRKVWATISSLAISLILKSNLESSVKSAVVSSIRQIRLSNSLFLLLLALSLRKEHLSILKIAFRNFLEMRWLLTSNAALATRKQCVSSAIESIASLKFWL